MIDSDSASHNKLPLVRFNSELRRIVQQWRRKGHKIGLVPTMGGLHEGHLALVRIAKKHASKVIVSTFVNPAQFAPNEDFNNYPRNEERDWHKLTLAQADAMYSPQVSEIYPDDFSTRVEVAGVTQSLEGVSRPHHFSGVTTIVTKLFLQCLPDLAVFGQKDYQQLLAIKRLVKDLNFPISIVDAPIIRETNGLALSSRNIHLDDNERAKAPRLYAALKDVAVELSAGQPIAATLDKGKARLEDDGFRIDYLQVRHAETLLPFDETIEKPARLLAAVYLGQIRLIDNIAVN